MHGTFAFLPLLAWYCGCGRGASSPGANGFADGAGVSGPGPWTGAASVRAGADTHHAVDADILRKLGKDGYIVNVSRGSVIDERALVAALTDQTIAGAGLDVYEKEPHAPDALTAFPNVVLTPHIGGHTLESHTAMQNCVIANLEAFFEGKPLPYAVRGG